MIIQQEKLAKKYAQAFVNLYHDRLTKQSLPRLNMLYDFCKTNKKFFTLINLSSLDDETKKSALNHIAQILKLEPFILHMLHVLLEHKRIHLLKNVLKSIDNIYKDGEGIITFDVITSHKLNDQHKESLTHFIKSTVEENITINIRFSIDHRLISGIKIKSDTLYWEYSLTQQLKTIKQNIYQRVGL
jgi:F-type H+-transporting ATPase subunit delta